MNIPDEIRGQGVALNNSLINSCFLLGSFIGGLLVYPFGIIGTIALSGMILIGLFVALQVNNFVQSKKTIQLKI